MKSVNLTEVINKWRKKKENKRVLTQTGDVVGKTCYASTLRLRLTN